MSTPHIHTHDLPLCPSPSSTSTEHTSPISQSSSKSWSSKKPTLGGKSWVEPSSLPPASHLTLEHHDASQIEGNAPLSAKQLALNTFAAYGVGDSEAFGHAAGRKVRFVRIDVDVDVGSQGQGRIRDGGGGDGDDDRGLEFDTRHQKGGRRAARENKGLGGSNGHSVSSATAVAELVVDKSMVNGNGMMHGGCIAYLIDNCGSVPLVVLGLVRERNGVGVTQALNVLFHAPAPIGSRLEIVSTSLALGGRSMTSRCEIIDKSTGRLVASAFINKMEPKL